MKNPEIEFHSDIDKQFGLTINMNPGSFKSLLEPQFSQPEAARVAGAMNARGLLAAFEQVVSRFEVTNALEADCITNKMGSARFGCSYSDLEKAFAAASPLNLEAVPALEY
jgi:hypothetical protein